MASPSRTAASAGLSPTSTVATMATTPASYKVIVTTALNQLVVAASSGSSSTSAKRKDIKEACTTALLTLESMPFGGDDARALVFRPLDLACSLRQHPAVSVAVDCLGKLFALDFWGESIPSPGSASTPKRNGGVGGGMRPDGLGGFDDLPDEDDDHDDPFAPSASPARKPGTDTDGSRPHSRPNQPFVHAVVDAICAAFAGPDTTDEATQLQIVKAISAASTTANTRSAIHGSLLLKAIRTTYNIFLQSKSNKVQTVAQASVAQMVQTVYSRIPADMNSVAFLKAYVAGESLEPSASGDGSLGNATQSTHSSSNSNTAPEVSSGVSESHATSHDEAAHGDAHAYGYGSHGGPTPLQSLGEKDASVKTSHEILSTTPALRQTSVEAVYDQHIRDAFLVFRALCKLSMKPISGPDGPTDLKSTAMRSKLLSLHLVHLVLRTYDYVFFLPAATLFASDASSSNPQAVAFIMAVKQYLCLVFTRNIVSVVPQVFDITMSIFGRILLGLRMLLKKEVSVMFTQVILPFVEAKPSSTSVTFHQRIAMFQSLRKTLGDETDGGRVLVELYLNYDCDVAATAHENIWERLISLLAKAVTAPADVLTADKTSQIAAIPASYGFSDWTAGGIPSIATSSLTNFTRDQTRELYSAAGNPIELKMHILDLLVHGILAPVISWCHKHASVTFPTGGAGSESADALDEGPGDPSKLGLMLSAVADPASKRKPLADDPAAFETIKIRKQVMIEGVKLFNFKPKKGMQKLLNGNVIPSRTPKDIAKFLLNTDGLNKSMIGEFLGEGEEENIAIMHAFVDEMDFSNMAFVEALRHFLQSFRLPGESQKIDRFMLKFAERYVKGNPKSFSSADTAYVLAYSVIMLNTDQHNAQVKRRMTKSDFLKNNRGIDEGKDIAAEVLEGIFDEIQSNEIVMKDEVDKPGKQGQADGAPETRRPRRELNKMLQKGEQITQQTEALMSNLHPARGNGSATSAPSQNGQETENLFFAASHYEHVKPMFQLVWMSILMVINMPLLQSDNMDTILLALEGFKHATHLSCIFDLELEKRGFISSLAKFTTLSNVAEVKTKNLEAAKTLIQIALGNGDYLHGHWVTVIACVSQLEKLQLIGADSSADPSRSRSSQEYKRKDQSAAPGAKSTHVEDAAAAAELGSQSMALLVDRIFSASAKLSGPAIVELVRALCDMSWEEIKSSSDKEHPRMYCLQRLVEISYYNMKRIRVEWSQLWAILGAHINQVGAHGNTNVAYFALDKLRQLAYKFLELEELPNFKFQKDFLRPFEEILVHNPDLKIKDMVLACLQQLVQAKAKNFKSGWKATFSSLCKAAREPHESVVLLSLDILRSIFKSHFELVIQNHAFSDFVTCTVEFCKNQAFPKSCLQAVELLHQAIVFVEKMTDALTPSKMAFAATEQMDDVMQRAMLVVSIPAVDVSDIQGEPNTLEENPLLRFWFPVLFGLYEVVMTCDLEVRTRALTFMFEALTDYGGTFTQDFWSLIHKGVIFPIFDDLRLARRDQSKFASKEDLSVWLSTTLIQALRRFVDLFSSHFDALVFLIDDLLDLLMTCMTQENETLSKLGSTCLQQLIELNVAHLTEPLWDKICDRLLYLLETTMPHELFFDLNDATAASSRNSRASSSTRDDNGREKEASDLDADANEASENSSPTVVGPLGRPYAPRPQKSDFQRIIVKCVLHLQVIQTLQELLSSDKNATVYNSLPSRNVLSIVDAVYQSYTFAQAFNANTELRTALFKMGFMKQLPNLLKQETASVSGYLLILFRMYADHTLQRASSQDEVEKRLIPLAMSVLLFYNTLDPETRKRNVNAWRPVVQIIIQGIAKLDDEPFERYIRQFYMPIVGMLSFELANEDRAAVKVILQRAGHVFGLSMPTMATFALVPRATIPKDSPVVDSAADAMHADGETANDGSGSAPVSDQTQSADSAAIPYAETNDDVDHQGVSGKVDAPDTNGPE